MRRSGGDESMFRRIWSLVQLVLSVFDLLRRRSGQAGVFQSRVVCHGSLITRPSEDLPRMEFASGEASRERCQAHLRHFNLPT